MTGTELHSTIQFSEASAAGHSSLGCIHTHGSSPLRGSPPFSGANARGYGYTRGLAALTAAVLMAAGCDEYDIPGILHSTAPTVNARFEDSQAWNEAHGFNTYHLSSESYKVFVCTDAHVDKKAPTLDEFVDSCVFGGGAPFSIFLGDTMLEKDGLDGFIKAVTPLLIVHNDTLFCIPGNHDICFNGWDKYYEELHTATYRVEAVTPSGRTDTFIFLDTADGTLGTKQRVWLEEQLEYAQDKGHITVCSHTHFFNTDNSQGHTSNFTLEETADILSLLSRYKVDLVLTGHDHSHEDLSFKGVHYLVLDAISELMDKPAFYAFHYGPDEITYTEYER